MASKILGTFIGDNCYFEEYCVVHACTLGENILVGENSVIMDGSKIGHNSIISADTLIPPGKNFPSYSLISGSPARLIKKINKEFIISFNKNKLRSKNNHSNYILSKSSNIKDIKIEGNNVFISPDLQCNCDVTIKKDSSIWFSVLLQSSNAQGAIFIDEGSNIQDNSILNTCGEKIKIGKKVTIGHNVIINGKATIHDNAVIGMGTIIEKNCLIEKNAFVGAKSYLKKNTLVPSGQIYAGNPAKFFRYLSSKEYEYFSMGQKIYVELTKEYLK